MKSRQLLALLALSLALGLVVVANMSDGRVIVVPDSEAAQIVAGGCTENYKGENCVDQCSGMCYTFVDTNPVANACSTGNNPCSASNCGSLSTACSTD